MAQDYEWPLHRRLKINSNKVVPFRTACTKQCHWYVRQPVEGSSLPLSIAENGTDDENGR